MGMWTGLAAESSVSACCAGGGTRSLTVSTLTRRLAASSGGRRSTPGSRAPAPPQPRAAGAPGAPPLTSAVTRMNPRLAPTYGDLERHRSTLPPPSNSGAYGSRDSHVPWSDLQLVLDSITRAEAAARQAANIAQDAATCFNAEAAVLQQAKDTLRINVLR